MTTIRVLTTPEEMEQVENLQRLIWPGSETDIVPAHLLVTLAHNGGLVLGAYQGEDMVGHLFGFPGLYHTPDGLRPKHCSHQAGVHPAARNAGIGFMLKQAQWQMVRQQGLDCVTWTYDPLLSRNGHLNIGLLGAVCNTYLREHYGVMRDGLNAGLPSDRFQVDWWINTQHVADCMEIHPHPTPVLADFVGKPRYDLPGTSHGQSADIQNLYTVNLKADLLMPSELLVNPNGSLLLAEIPVNFLKLKEADFELALTWRMFMRQVFETCFSAGYLITNFIYDINDERPRSFYVLTHNEATS